jgi:hypothetical protein
MIESARKRFNASFTVEKYNEMLADINNRYGVNANFRIAETPFFIPKLLKERLTEACSLITDVIVRPDIKDLTQATLYDPSTIVPGEDAHTTFLQMDFGISMDENGDPIPYLIEVQGFPSVYFFQYLISDIFPRHFDIDGSFSAFFDPSMTHEQYKQVMRNVIVGDSDPKEVVLLEIEPEKQTTYIDMHVTESELGIKVLCISKVIKQENKLYYRDQNDSLVRIKKIYNRVIFDELYQRPDIRYSFNFTDDLDVEWIGHPNWFYRISKYLVPFLKNKYVPETYFLNDIIDKIPDDLENYVLKPLFSFAGAGVIIDVTKDEIYNISEEDRSNFVLQKKVNYEPVIKSPNEPVKVEIRMLMLWPKDDERPYIVTNLARLSKGKMIGVKYNKDKDWVGGSVGFFEA